METGTKINLSDLSKIPPKEFERNFREWLDRDDVARSLQAQLRMDLIKNFNKTALGRQILSQATSTNKPYGATAAQRLTLSPMVLALNTLVAEFLYAENCHFSLSVFCTEIPFRNTLPDFENSQYFRFTENEICEILEAVSSTVKYEKDLINKIVKEYATNSRSSLLMLILKHIIHMAMREPWKKTEKSPPPPTSPEIQKKTEKLPISPESKKTSLLSESLPNAVDEKKNASSRPETKAKKITDDNLNCVNKYLITLSNKLQSMSKQLYLLQQQQQQKADPKALPRPRQLKSASQHSLRILNRSLETITGNLKKMAQAKRKNKRIDVIVTAIDTMSKQFEKCAANFEKISEHLADDELLTQRKEILTSMKEKSYTEWIDELRSSQHGQKFLDKVESSLRKALNKQKKFLSQEIETKLHHQKELLKIRYKQKLMKHLPRRDPSLEFDKLNNSVEKELEQFELKHCEMIQKLHDEEQNVVRRAVPSKIMPVTMVEIKSHATASTSTTNMATRPSEALVITLKSPELKPRSRSPTMSPKIAPKPPPKPKSPTKQAPNKAAQPLTVRGEALKVATQNNLDEMFQQLADDERKVDNIVFDAKLRLQELEIESNQLEENFHSYLERQQKQNQICREASATMWNNYLLEKNKVEKNYQMLRQATQCVPQAGVCDIKSCNKHNAEREYQKFLYERNVKQIKSPPTTPNKDDTNSSSSSNCKNAILEAKAKFFNIEKPHTGAKQLGKKTTFPEFHYVPEDAFYTIELYHKEKSDPGKVRNKSKGRKRIKAIDSKTGTTNLLTATAKPEVQRRIGPYDTETEVSGVETNDSHVSSSSEVEIEVLLPELGSSKIIEKLHETDRKMQQNATDPLLHHRQRLKPWTTTSTTTKSTDHKKMQTLFAARGDNVGDYGDSNTKKKSTKEKHLNEEEPATSQIQRHVVSKVESKTPTTTTTTMVLQQSMAKMNRLFQNEQQRRRQIKKQHKLKEQKQQQLQVFLQQQKQQTLERTNMAEKMELKRTVSETTPRAISKTTIGTNTSSTIVLTVDDKKTVANANAVVIEKSETVRASASTAAILPSNGYRSEGESEKKIEKKKSAADKLTETVATLTSRRTTTSEAATETTDEQLPTKLSTLSTEIAPTAATAQKNSTPNNCFEMNAFNGSNTKQVVDDNQRRREQQIDKQQQLRQQLEQEKLRRKQQQREELTRQQQVLKQQSEKQQQEEYKQQQQVQEDAIVKQQQAQEEQRWHKQQQHEYQAKEQQLDKQEQAEQQQQEEQWEEYQDLKQQSSSHELTPPALQEETSSLQTEIEIQESAADGDADSVVVAAAVAAGGSSPPPTFATSQLDVDVGVAYDIEADTDDYDDLVLAPFNGSTMSMSSLLAFQFSTGFDRSRSNIGASSVGTGGGGGGAAKKDNDGSEFWA